MSNPAPFSEQLRHALADSPATRYRIAQETGIKQSVLSLFMARKRGLSIQSIDALVEVLGLELRPVRTATRRRKIHG